MRRKMITSQTPTQAKRSEAVPKMTLWIANLSCLATWVARRLRGTLTFFSSFLFRGAGTALSRVAVRREPLNREIFPTLGEAKMPIEG